MSDEEESYDDTGSSEGEYGEVSHAEHKANGNDAYKSKGKDDQGHLAIICGVAVVEMDVRVRGCFNVAYLALLASTSMSIFDIPG
mmetsp:Transcript_25433/g.51810  ORF Transcript_25433/g.51810 Transcript_25433/m.51810 type:complete len:85 (-) Transcript_25433:1703-1957(-)